MAWSVVMVLFLTLVCFPFVLYHGAEAVTGNEVMKIGAIIDVNSRIGKEEKIGMEIAVQNFNKTSKTHKLSLSIQQPHRVTSVG
jgi:hypothetical protein